MAKIRSITVNFNAGTAKFGADVDKASQKIRQFGGHSVSSMQASSAAIRTFEGNIQNNVRAVERFMVTTLKLGPALQASFNVVGAVAFLGLLTEVGDKANEFFKGMRTAPEKMRAAFSSVTGELRLTNDQLKVANDRLENDIAKLEGKHQNTLKLALDEARLSADKLGESLKKDLASINQMLEKNTTTAMERLWGKGDDRDINSLMGGESGVGGVGLRVSQIIQAGNREIDAAIATANARAGGPTKQDQANVIAVRDRIAAAATKELSAALEEVNKKLRERQAVEKAKTVGFYGLSREEQAIYPQKAGTYGSQVGSIEKLQDLGITLGDVQRTIPTQLHNADLTAKKEKLTADSENAKEDRPFEDRMKKFKAEIEAVTAKLDAIGKSQAAQNIAKAFGESQKAIEEVNKALERHHTQLTAGQKEQIRTAETTLVNTEAEEQWKTKLAAATTSIDDRIRSQNLLTDAIGKGYEATKQANVETKLMQELGQHYNDAGWMKDHASDVSGLRSGYAKEYDAQHADQVGQAVQKLREEIELEKALASAQRDGAEAVRQAGLAVKLRQMAAVGATKAQIQAEMELYNAKRENNSAAEIAKIEEKIEATERLTDAIAQGATGGPSGIAGESTGGDCAGRRYDCPNRRDRDRRARSRDRRCGYRRPRERCCRPGGAHEPAAAHR